jgi:hypothetical protein
MSLMTHKARLSRKDMKAERAYAGDPHKLSWKQGEIDTMPWHAGVN